MGRPKTRLSRMPDHTFTYADPIPDDLRTALTKINNAGAH